MEIWATQGGGSGTDRGAAANIVLMAGEQFKLCLYSANCCGNEFESVDGRSVSCIELGTAPQSWQVVLRGHNC